MGGQTHPFTDVMVFEELPVVEETIVVVKKAIKKSEARTQLTAAKKAKAKKAKKPKAKKAKKAKKPKKKKKKKKKAKKKKKKRKKKKAKKVRFVGGKRRKGQHKSKAVCAAAKKKAAAMKKKGVGIFKPVSCSAALSAITGGTSSERMRFSFPSDLNAWEQGVLRPAVTFTKVLAETGDAGRAAPRGGVRPRFFLFAALH